MKLCRKKLHWYTPEKWPCGENKGCSKCAKPRRNANSLKYQTKLRIENPDKAKNLQYKSLYGITLDQKYLMLMDQSSCCKICNKHASNFPKGLHTDHDHSTGKVRSLLCSNCNTALGKMSDNPQLLRKAAEYLEEHS